MQDHSYPSPLVELTIKGAIDGRTFSHAICIPRDERFRIEAVIKRGEYALAPFRGRQRPRVVLDIGANVGLFALYMKLVDPEAVIHCYEPVQSTLALLHRNVGQFPAVHVHPYALGKAAGNATIHLHHSNTGQHSLKKIEASSQYCGAEEITCHSAAQEADALGLPCIDVLKIDTEGCEIEILESLGERLQIVDYMLLEYHSESDRRQVDRLLPDFLLYSARSIAIGRGTLKYLHRRLLQ